MLLWKQNSLRPIGNSAPQRKITGVTSHNLHDTAALVGCGRITYLVDRFHRCIDCRIKSDRILSTRNIQINRPRNTDCVDAKIGQRSGSLERTISANHNQPVNLIFFTNRRCSLLSFLCAHLLTSCGLKNRSSTLNCIRNIPCSHINNIFIQKS